MARYTDELAATLKNMEEQLLRPAVRKDRELLLELLSSDFREFGSSGRVSTWNQIVEWLGVEDTAEIALEDFAVERLCDGCVLATYRACHADAGRVMRESLRSSIWLKRHDRWQMVFHQGTKVSSNDG